MAGKSQVCKIEGGEKFLRRCLICNALLNDIDRTQVEYRVPQYVYETQAVFRVCPLCSRIFWHATQKDAMVRQLEAMLAG